jgi:hypothetical protein
MEIRYNLTGAERKRLAQAVSELLETPLSYKGAPTFAYEAGAYRIDKAGTINGPDNWELAADLSGLYSFVAVEKTYDVEPSSGIEDALPIVCFGGGTRPNYDCDYNAEGPQASDCENQDALTIEMPLDGFTEEALANLDKLIASKASLIRKAIGADDLMVVKTEDKLQFPWFWFSEDGETVAAYTRFISALCAAAKEHKRVTAREKDVENEKFAFRVFLIRLGFVGTEFKQARKILLKNLSGNSAFKGGRPAVKEGDAE